MPIDNSIGRSIIFRKGRLAQLARASRLHREGRGFESLNAHIESFVKPIVSRSFFRCGSSFCREFAADERVSMNLALF